MKKKKHTPVFLGGGVINAAIKDSFCATPFF